MASPAQIAANQANALKSSGPKTAEGKDASRRNALKHGLAARSLVLPEEEAQFVADRIAAWTPSLSPRHAYDSWLVEQVVVSSVQIERCQAEENSLRTRQAARATFCWDVDRECEAEDLGANLSKSPARVARALRATKQGCAWLILRWEGLARVLDARGDWDDAQKRLALDLLGTPKDLRDGPTPLDGDRPALIREQLDALETLKAEALEYLDDRERDAAAVGLGPDFGKAVARVRRYEAAAVRRMQWAQAELKKGRGAEARHSAPIEPEPRSDVPEEPERLPELPAGPPPPLPVVVAATPRIETAPVGKPARPKLENRKTRLARKALARRG